MCIKGHDTLCIQAPHRITEPSSTMHGPYSIPNRALLAPIPPPHPTPTLCTHTRSSIQLSSLTPSFETQVGKNWGQRSFPILWGRMWRWQTSQGTWVASRISQRGLYCHSLLQYLWQRKEGEKLWLQLQAPQEEGETRVFMLCCCWKAPNMLLRTREGHRL